MTDSAKTTLWVIIILVLVGGIWWFVGSNPSSQTATPAIQQVNSVQSTSTEVVPTTAEDASTSISVQDKTDAALDSDLGKVDAQLKDLNTGSAN